MSITDMKLLFRGEQIAKTCLNFSVTNCSTTLLHKLFSVKVISLSVLLGGGCGGGGEIANIYYKRLETKIPT